MVVFMFRPCKPSFSSCIAKIILLCTKKKMFLPDARRIVAMMANRHTVRDRTEVKLPGHSVCHFVNAVYLNLAVSLRTPICRPDPARTEFRPDGRPVLVDLRPESFFDRL